MIYKNIKSENLATKSVAGIIRERDEAIMDDRIQPNITKSKTRKLDEQSAKTLKEAGKKAYIMILNAVIAILESYNQHIMSREFNRDYIRHVELDTCNYDKYAIIHTSMRHWYINADIRVFGDYYEITLTVKDEPKPSKIKYSKAL